MPAAQEAIESRRSHCFFTMSSSNRWTRASAAEAQASCSSRRPDFPDSHMMMKWDAVRQQGDMLRKRSRKSLLTKREHHYHYQRKIIWHSVQDIDIRQHGFKLRRVWGRNVNVPCIVSLDQTICQISIDSRWPWMLFLGSSIGDQNIENSM